MKILIDPIYTNDPALCSMAWKMKEVVNHLLKVRDDVYVYWITPIDSGPKSGFGIHVDLDWFPKSERVHYISVPVSRDRMVEYFRYVPEIYDVLMFGGSRWDWDLLVTSRVPMVPIARQVANKFSDSYGWSRRVVVVEDMPLLGFKKTVAQIQTDAQSLLALSGYSSAHSNYFMSFWERGQVIKYAKDYLSPSRVRDLANKSYDSTPILFKKTELKSQEMVQRVATGGKPFTIGYTQRLEVTHRRADDIISVFEKHWVYRAGKHKLRFVITTNSRGATKVHIPEFIECVRSPREEFLERLRTEIDVVIVMSIDDAYPLSLIEPLMFGVPVVLLRACYTDSIVGEDYPFYIQNEYQAYAMVREFFNDYAGMYAKFKAWYAEVFAPLMSSRNDRWLPYCIESEVETVRELQKTKAIKLGQNSIVQELQNLGPELRITDGLSKLSDAGVLRDKRCFFGNTLKRDYQSRLFVLPDLNRYRLGLLASGYRDASTSLGHMIRG